jgi:hypothetical protein
MGVSKLSRFGTLATLRTINFFADLWSWWGLKQNCSPHQDLSNSMLHATYTQGNRVDSWLFVVGSQIANLIPDLFLGHNLCFRCPNGSCETILNIYISIDFQWYKELFKTMGFDPYNRSLKIRESTKTPTPKMGAHLEVWVFIFTLSHTPSWPAFLQALVLVVSPRLRLRHPNWKLAYKNTKWKTMKRINIENGYDPLIM